MIAQSHLKLDVLKWLVHSLTALGFFIIGLHFTLMLFEHNLRLLDVLTRVLPCMIIGFWVFLKADKVMPVVLVIVALFFNAFGDLLLKFPGDLFFIVGLFSHLMGHILYIVSFTLGNRKLKIIQAVIPMIYLGFMLYLLMPVTKGIMRYAVLIYSSVIVIMLWRAAAVIGQKGKITSPEIFRLLGALLFVVSDTLLAIKVFIQPVEGIGFPIMICYWAGLWLIAVATIDVYPLKAKKRVT